MHAEKKIDKNMQRTKDVISEFFLNAEKNILLPVVVGFDIDENNNRIWVCSNDFSTGDFRVTAIDLISEEATVSFDKDHIKGAPKPFNTFFNDVVTDDFGNAYIINSYNNTIIKVSADLSNVRTFTTDFPNAPEGKSYTFNSIRITPDGKTLMVNFFTNTEESITGLFQINMSKEENIAIHFYSNEKINFNNASSNELSFINRKKIVGCYH